MKVLIVSPYFYPAWHYGGPPRVAFEFAKALTQEGHDVTVYTTDTLNRKERIKSSCDEVEKVKILYFRNRSNSFSSHFLYFNPLGFYQHLQKEIDQFDVVHLNEFRTHMTYYAARLADQHRKPTFLHIRGALPIIMERFWLKRLFDQLYGNWMLQNVTRIVALADGEKRDALARGIASERIFISPDGIEMESFQDLPSKLIKRKEWGIPEHDKVILHLGRIHKKKGLDFLVEALQMLPDKPYHLVLAGPDFGFSDQLRSMQQKLVHPIRFIGTVEGEEKKQTLAAADLLALPSRSEGLPGAVLEAMACGLPVLVSPFCNLNEIADYQAGRVVELDPKKIALALSDILESSQDKRALFGAQGKRMVQDHFLWKVQVKRFVALYQETIAELQR